MPEICIWKNKDLRIVAEAASNYKLFSQQIGI